MKTSGIIIFTVDLFMVLYAGYNAVARDQAVSLENLEKPEEKRHTANWVPYIGMGLMVFGGALLVLDKRKSLSTG
jgi:hypothetical protein